MTTVRTQLKTRHDSYTAQVQRNSIDALPEDLRRALAVVETSFGTGRPVPTKLTPTAPDATRTVAPQRGPAPRERDGNER